MDHCKLSALVFLLYLGNFASTVKGKLEYNNLAHLMNWLRICIHVHSPFIEDIEVLEVLRNFSKRNSDFVSFILRNS